MGFELDRNESAVKFKERIAAAKTGDLLGAVGVMRREIYFAAQFPFLLEELERRGHTIAEAAPVNSTRVPKMSLAIAAALALAILFFDGHIWLRDMIYGDLVKFHLILPAGTSQPTS